MLERKAIDDHKIHDAHSLKRISYKVTNFSLLIIHTRSCFAEDRQNCNISGGRLAKFLVGHTLRKNLLIHFTLRSFNMSTLYMKARARAKGTLSVQVTQGWKIMETLGIIYFGRLKIVDIFIIHVDRIQ